MPTDTWEYLKIADSKGRLALGSKYAGKRFAVREEADGSVVVTPVRITPDLIPPRADGFAWLEALQTNWDGRGSLAPSVAAIEHARETTALLRAGTLARRGRWTEPHVGVNERGDVTLEWWNQERALTVFVRADGSTEYLKSWGANIATEMEDGPLDRLGDFAALARWLGAAQPAA